MSGSSRPTRRVLILSPYFPPRRRVGGLRAFKFARRLAEFGYEPHVVCLESPGERATDAERAALSRMDVLELSASVDSTRKRSSSSVSKVARDPNVFDRLADAVDRRMPVDSWLPWLFAHRAGVVRHARSREVDLVFCTGDPWSSHLFGRSIARALSVPYVADFRDPWTLCTVRGHDRPSWVRSLDARAEAMVVRDAAALVFTSSRASALYRANYRGAGEKIVTIRNGYDESAFGDPVDATRASGRIASSSRATLDLLFFGTFRPLAPALPVIRWLEGLRRLAPELLDGVRVQSMGSLDAEDRAAAERAGVLACFESVPPVPYELSLTRQRQADLLLVASDERRDDMIPAKLFDALPAGRPVVSLATNPEVAGILRHTGTGETVDGRDPAWIARLAAMVRAKRANEPLPVAYAPDVRALRAYEATRLTEDLAHVFDSVLA